MARLEAASDRAARMPVVFITLVPTERASPATATAGHRVWHRDSDELEGDFLRRVGREARLARSGDAAAVVFLD